MTKYAQYAQAEIDSISNRLQFATEELKQAKAALKKFESNPTKYYPQLDNLNDSVNTVRKISMLVSQSALRLKINS